MIIHLEVVKVKQLKISLVTNLKICILTADIVINNNFDTLEQMYF